MDQAKIWEYFQNHDEAGGSFDHAIPRYKFLARQVPVGCHALNVGVGRGGLESILTKNGVVVSCLDPSESSIERVRHELGFGDRAQVGRSEIMPFAESQFDVVIMSEVLEHLTSDTLNATLAEVRRVLRPGGRFIGTVPANEVLQDNRVMCPHCGEQFHRWGHVQSFSLERMREILTNSHFAIQRNETRAFPSWQRTGVGNLAKSVVRYVLGRAGASIAQPSIFFEARRSSANEN